MPLGDVTVLPVRHLTGAQGISREDHQRMAARLLACTDDRAEMEPREACTQLVREVRSAVDGWAAKQRALADAGFFGEAGKPYSAARSGRGRRVSRRRVLDPEAAEA
jgi:hypothetical protein